MSNPFFRRLLAALGVVVVAVLGTNRAAAQEYFGRNKVQYKKLDFQVLKTEHFDIYFYPSERDGIDIAARLAERWNTRLERLLEHTLRGRQPLVLYASHPDFEQTNTIQGELGEGTGGVTEPLKRRIILPLGGPIADTDHVIGHELVHAYQYDITTGPNMAPGENGAERLPLWFIEGMAEYLSIGPVDPNTAMWLRDAARENKLPTVDDLDNPKYFPYRWGQAFWAYVGGKWGDAVIPQMLRIGAASGGDTSVTIKRVLGLTTKELTEEWHASIRTAYEPILRNTTPPAEIGRLTIKATNLGGELNVGPAISPDGRWIAFLSERSLFSIDLFIADAETGKVVHKLTSTATDPHYSSIQFIYSAGAWDADSKRIAIATVVSGHPALAIFNAESGSKERELPLETLDEIFNPTWAPDGHAVCFTGMSRGLTDLYVLDLNTSDLRQLTRDAYADLQPAWSPDGRRIAFATDRFSSRLDTLDMGPYRIALANPDTGAITQVPAFTGGKNMNPQWSPDGQAIFFISDRDGISNLYRLAIDSGDIRQITKVGTGLSGITATSPALSVASKAGVAAFSVYEAGKYDIFTLPLNDVALLRELTPASMTAATLPPLDRRPSDVVASLANATEGLPAPAQENEVTKYKPALSLLALGQPTIGLGVSRFGTSIGGGISAYFGDILGDHTLAAAVSFNSLNTNFSAKNTAVQVAYFNQAHRWNWGVVGGQVPYLSGGVNQGIGTVAGQQALVNETIIYRQTERSAAGMLAYPFNRSHRVEFQGGISQVSFDQIVQTQAFSLRTGDLFFDNTEETSLANSLTLGTSSAALVYDTSNFGATSPVQGSRYRVEASPTFGSINFTSMTADYRRYFMPAPFYTLAVRGLHYGRYGSGSEDGRLFPLFLGYPNFVRGYDVYSFDASDCGSPTTTSTCPGFDRLLGSRMLVGNIEFRFPLLRPFGASQRMYGPIPVEVAFFADGGVAWNSLKAPLTTTTALLGTNTTTPHPFNWNDGVSSAGLALRMNLFGFAVGEFDFVRPFQRPSRGWIFQFNLTPGF